MEDVRHKLAYCFLLDIDYLQHVFGIEEEEDIKHFEDIIVNTALLDDQNRLLFGPGCEELVVDDLIQSTAHSVHSYRSVKDANKEAVRLS
jgi:hypothetical protein